MSEQSDAEGKSMAMTPTKRGGVMRRWFASCGFTLRARLRGVFDGSEVALVKLI